MRPLRPQTLIVVAALAVGVLAWVVVGLSRRPPGSDDWLLAGLCAVGVIVAWRFPVQYAFRQRVCADDAVTAVAVLLLAPPLACAVAVVGALVGNLAVDPRGRAQALFNGAQTGLAAGAGGLLLAELGWRGQPEDFARPSTVPTVVAALLAMYLVNTAAVAIVVGLDSRLSAVRLWVQSVTKEPVHALGSAALGGLGAATAALVVHSPWLSLLMAAPVLATALLLRQSLRAQATTQAALGGMATTLTQAQRIAGVGSFEWDLATGEHRWSEQTYVIFGVPHEPVPITHEVFLQSIHPADRAWLDGALRSAAEGGRPVSAEVRVVQRHGAERLARLQTELVITPDGHSRLVGAIHDVTEQTRLRVELVHRASHDALTGLANRAAFLERLDELQRPGRLALDLSVAYLDLDDFKRVNDTLGHPFGDRLLVEVASRLRSCLGPGDVAARFGGDEFVLLLVGSTRTAEVRAMADRLGEAVRQPFTLGETTLDVAASIGIAATSERLDPSRLLGDADTALYHAKFAGKNRTVISAPRLVGDLQDRRQNGPRSASGASGRSTWVPYLAADGTRYEINEDGEDDGVERLFA